MQDMEIEIKPVTWVSCDAIGKPGERTFYIAARGEENEAAVVLVEKVQLQTLVPAVAEFLEELHSRYADLEAEDTGYDAAGMRILPPVDPLYRVGEIGLAYAEDEDFAVILLREVMTTQESEEELRSVRLWVRRSQLAALADWAQKVINQGRKICPQCGEPMDPAGHLCPKKNGHKH